LQSEKFKKVDKSDQSKTDMRIPQKKRPLAPSTQKDYKRMLLIIEQEYGSLPISALEENGIQNEFEEWKLKIAAEAGAREADNRVSVLSAMITWAISQKDIPLNTNLIKGLDRLYESKRREVIWSPEAITKFMQHGCEMMQAAMILALHTAMRQGDLRALKWIQYDGTYIKYKPSKTRGTSSIVIQVKCTPTLKNMLDSMERRSKFILCTKTGGQFEKRNFAKYWEEAYKKAEIEPVTLEDDGLGDSGEAKELELHFHDLRGTAISYFEKAGCSDTETRMITGHKSKTEDGGLGHYKSWSKVLADQAIDKFAASPNTRFANQLQTDFMKKSEKKLND
jgi:integrase